MRSASRALRFLAVLLAPTAAAAAGYNRVYLVPALKACPGFATCGGRELESTYTFESIVLRSPPGRYLPAAPKPSLFLQVKGVRDASGAPVNGNLTLKVLSGRVNVPGIGTIGDDSGLTTVAPVPIPLKNGSNPKFSYRNPTTPGGLLVNGGGVEVYDPEGKLLAVTGSQTKP
jgi:hypothetical protein